MSRLKAASNKPAYDPNEPTDDNEIETPVEVENYLRLTCRSINSSVTFLFYRGFFELLLINYLID